MDLLRLLLLSTVVGRAYASPIAPAGEGPEAADRIPGRREAQGSVIIYPLPSGPGCTTTLYQTYSYPCSWAGTLTLYPSTTVQTRQVDCNGCSNILVQADYFHCPNQRIDATELAATPSTYYSTVCRPSPAPRSQQQQAARRAAPATTSAEATSIQQPLAPAPTPASPNPDPELRLRDPHQAAAGAACPTTVVVQPERSAGRTKTVYASYTTTTVLVECSGCGQLVTSTALAGYGPPQVFTTTTTLPVGVVTGYACRD